VPCVQLVTGSMLTGSHQGERVGACTDCRRYWGRYRAEEIDADEIQRVNDQLVASVGTCSVMGTASTMACIAEALGIGVDYPLARLPELPSDKPTCGPVLRESANRLPAKRFT